MKHMKICIVLLALLLAAMVMVPLVSATDDLRSLPNNKDLIESNYIPVETAQEHATISMLSMIQSGALDSNWAGAKINPAPQEIFDINGERLFYLFSVEKKSEPVGEIYAAASKVLGGSVIAIGSINEQGKTEKLKTFSQKALNEKYSGYQVISEKTVCFDYPVIGSMINLNHLKTGEEKTIIIDSRDGSEKNKTTQVSSYYNQISTEEMTRNVATWNKHNIVLEEKKNLLVAENPEILVTYSEIEVAQLKEVFSNAKSTVTSIKSRLLQDDMEILPALTHSTQYTNVWCAVATAQMISSKYMIPPWGQYHIADMMDAYNPDGTAKGTTLNDELEKYYKVTQANGGLEMTSSSPADRPYTTWEKARDEIDAGRPLKIGRDYPTYHARACNGWMVNGGNQYLLFYDPAETGSIYWDLVAPGYTYNNFVYVR